MSKKTIGICDPYREYAERFAYFVWHRLGEAYDALAFSKPEKLKAILDIQKMDILIISEDFFEQYLSDFGSLPEDERRTTVILAEEKGGKDREFPTLYKYSSSEQILRDAKAIHDINEKILAIGSEEVPRRIAVYSPVKRCGKTTFARALAQAFGQIGGVLTFSLDEICVDEEGADTTSVSELLYEYLINGSCARIFDGMDAEEPVWRLKGANHPEDLRETASDTWARLLEDITVTARRRFIVADLGDAIPGIDRLIKSFDRIYIPSAADAISEKKLQAWEQRINELYPAPLLDRIRRVRVPFRETVGNNDETIPAQETDAVMALANSLILEDI